MTPIEPAIEEMRRAVAAIAVVGQIDGHDVVRQLSVLDIIDRRLATHRSAVLPVAPAGDYEGMRCMCALTGCSADPGCPHYSANCKKHIAFASSAIKGSAA
jgi:hypothetical protein